MSIKQQLKITFLGTGTSTGVPMIASNHPVAKSKDPRDSRLRPSIMVSWNNNNYIIDSGPDFRQQMLRENVQAIRGIFYTHEHADHIAGFDDIRAFSFKMGEVPIYVSERVLNILKKRFEYVFATENRYASAPKVQANIISHHKKLEFYGVTITPVEVMHGKLPILGYRFNNVAYLTDVKTVSKEEKKKLQNLDILIVTGLRIEPHPNHLNLEESLAFIKEIKPKKAYLTHISDGLGFHAEVEKELPENVFLAYDGLVLYN